MSGFVQYRHISRGRGGVGGGVCGAGGVGVGLRAGRWLVVVVLLAGWWWSRAGLVSPDDVCAVGGAVGDDGDGVVVRVAVEFVGEVVVQGRGVGEVQRDEGEVAGGDVLVEDAGVAGGGDAGGAGRAAGAGP